MTESNFSSQYALGSTDAEHERRTQIQIRDCNGTAAQAWYLP